MLITQFAIPGNIPQDLNNTHTIPSRQDYAPEMYSMGYRHASPSDLTSLAGRSLGYGGVGTRIGTPGPPASGSLQSMQTPRSFEETATYSYDGDGDVVMADLEDLKAIMDVMHHVHEKRFRDEHFYQREASLAKVNSFHKRFIA